MVALRRQLDLGAENGARVFAEPSSFQLAAEDELVAKRAALASGLGSAAGEDVDEGEVQTLSEVTAFTHATATPVDTRPSYQRDRCLEPRGPPERALLPSSLVSPTERWVTKEGKA